jgi:hypothetical protein
MPGSWQLADRNNRSDSAGTGPANPDRARYARCRCNVYLGKSATGEDL